MKAVCREKYQALITLHNRASMQTLKQKILQILLAYYYILQFNF